MKNSRIIRGQCPVVEKHHLPGPADASVRRRLQELTTASVQDCNITEEIDERGSLRYELEMRTADEPAADEIRRAFHVILDAAVGYIPLNPELPDGFENTANEERSIAHLAAWWDQPFVRGPAGGPYDIRCLDGGASDRPTWYGRVDSLDAAPEFAASKLRIWQELRRKPVAVLDSDGAALVCMPQHPHCDIEVIKKFASMDDLASYAKVQNDRSAQDPLH